MKRWWSTYGVATVALVLAIALGMAFMPERQIRQLALTPIAGQRAEPADGAPSTPRFAWTQGHVYRYRVNYESHLTVAEGSNPGEPEHTRLTGEMHIESYGQRGDNYVLGVTFRPDEDAELSIRTIAQDMKPTTLPCMFAGREVRMEISETGTLYDVHEEASHPPQFSETMRRLLLETQVSVGAGDRWEAVLDTPHGRAHDVYQRRGRMGDALAIQRVRTRYEDLKLNTRAGVESSSVQARHRVLFATAGHIEEMHGSERIVGLNRLGEAALEIESQLAIELMDVIDPNTAPAGRARQATAL